MKKIDDILCIRKVQVDNDEKVIITMGDKMVVGHTFENEEDAEKYIDEKPIELIFGIAVGVAKSMIDHEIKEKRTMVNNNKVENHGDNN